MVANDRSRSIGSDDDMSMTSFGDDVMTGHIVTVRDLECPHCDFHCNSPAFMTEHSWEQHPLLMRRKKHLITSSKMDSRTSPTSDEAIQGSNTSPVEKSPPPLQQTAQGLEDRSLSGENLWMESSEQRIDRAAQAAQYRNNAMRSLSLLSTAAAILEQQQQTPQRHIAVVKPQPLEPQQYQHQFLQFPEHPLYTPMYNAYIPSLNQYVAIPIHVAPSMPNPEILNANLGNAMNACLHTQPPPNTQFTQPISFLPPQHLTPQTVLSQNAPQPARKTTDEIRTLLQTNVPIRQIAPKSKPNSETHLTKIARLQPPEPTQTSRSPSQHPTLKKDRLQALEKAILSMDCCDINKMSTTMPFKCADGVWRMVSFKCIKGLWVVQTPESSTPTVYVPCDDDEMAKTSLLGLKKPSRTMSEVSRHKRRLSDNIHHELPVEAKRLCASAPILNLKTGGSETPLKRTFSNPFITKSLPPPSQQFTNNLGKRVNISMIKRDNSARASNCSLIKSLLLRKPAQTMLNMTSQVQNMTSQIPNNKMRCKSAPGRQIVDLPAVLSKNTMVY